MFHQCFRFSGAALEGRGGRPPPIALTGGLLRGEIAKLVDAGFQKTSL